MGEKSKRTYGDMCRFAHALDLLGERWALLVVRELLLGPKRFTDLRAGLPRASPNVLAERLRELEAAGVLRRRTLPPPAGSRVYELTEWGMELEPIVTRLGAWGARSPLPPPEATIGSDSIVLALGSLFDPEAAAGLSAAYELRLGEERYSVEVANGEIELLRGAPEATELAIEADPATLGAVLAGGLSLADARRSGDFRIEGDVSAAERFLALFPMPEPAPAP